MGLQQHNSLKFKPTLIVLPVRVQVLPKEVFDKPAGKSGNTPFHIAAASGNTDAVKCLLSAGINCSKWNAESRGATPLHVAVLHGKLTKIINATSSADNTRVACDCLPRVLLYGTPRQQAQSSCSCRERTVESDSS